MNKFVLTLCFIIVLLSLVMISCSSTGNTDFKKVKEIIPSGDENYLVNNSDYIFDQNILHTFELNLPESNLAEIDADPVAEKYVEGSLTFNGETISPVGIRYKGSIGAFVNALSRNNLFNPGGFKTSTKLSMKVKINWLDSDTTFYRLKKLQFHFGQHLDYQKVLS